MIKLKGIMKNVAICLFRNDLRYHDNEMLSLAHKNADHILPLYCFDPLHYKGTHHHGFPKTGSHRLQFLLESVQDLRSTLASHGSNLMISHEEPHITVSRILNKLTEYKVTLAYQSEVTKEETDVENNLQKVCQENGANCVKIWGSTLYHKEDLPFTTKTIPDTYTLFRKEVEAKARIRPETTMPDKLKPPPPIDPSALPWGDLPSFEQLSSTAAETQKGHPSTAFPFRGGETAALDRLKSYLWDSNLVARYKETRNGLIGADYSTKFSPWLALGCLSPRRIHWELDRYEKQRTKNDSTYWVRFELLWRDYFRFVSMKYGDRIFYPYGMKGAHKGRVWKKDMQLFKAWQMGQTGVPFVDANMRELLHTGWMSNRGRQNVASFLVKDLHLDWRLGAEWFESLLLDHDVCSNYGNWNYVAGIGNDPREDRKFNMIKQATDYDPDGHFIRLWVSELKNIPGAKIHTPWMLSIGALSAAGVRLGETYPNPVIVAPEWSRHHNKGGKDGPGAGKSGGQRGIDFYFKSSGGSK